MNPAEAAAAAACIGAGMTLPMHYGTWPLLTDDVSAFKPAGAEVKLMKAGETISV